NGRDIAFARFGPDGSCEVIIASATGGALRHVTRCDGTELLSFDWTPDGRGLLFGSLSGKYAHRGIHILTLASGSWTALDYQIDPDSFEYAPRYSPDGRWIVFVRNPQVGDLWRIPAGGGTPEQLTNDSAEIRGWAWRSDSRHIVFGRRVDSEA
ncbi:transcriptional regulator, partial [Mycobacterium tuberculosis]